LKAAHTYMHAYFLTTARVYCNLLDNEVAHIYANVNTFINFYCLRTIDALADFLFLTSHRCSSKLLIFRTPNFTLRLHRVTRLHMWIC